MNRIRRHLTIALLAAIASVGAAQESPSHTHIGDWDGGSTVQKARELERLLQSGKGLDLPRQQVEPELIQKFLDTLQRQGEPGLRQAIEKNPELKRALSNLDQNNPELRRQLENRSTQPFSRNGMSAEQIQKILESLKTPGGLQPGGHIDLPTMPQQLPQVGPMSSTTPPGSSGVEARLPNKPSRPLGPEGTPGAPRPSEQNRFADFIKRMKISLPDSIKESPNIKEFIKRLSSDDLEKHTPKMRLWPEGKGPKINWDRGVDRTGRFFDRLLGGIGSTRAPNLPHAPRMPNAPRMPGIDVPSGPGSLDLGHGFTLFMVAGALVLAAILFWRFVAKPMSLRAAKPKDWDAGPWPVDPANVRTREELIRAFDHLALINGGRPARMWHHREVANRLGLESDDRSNAAQRLADAYERARYAPPIEPVAETLIEGARRDICSLAGVAAS